MKHLRPIPTAWLAVPVFGLACASGPKDRVGGPDGADMDTGGPIPWGELVPGDLDSFHLMVDMTIDDSTTPSRILSLPDRAGAYVLDTAGSRVHVLDGRYNHDGRIYCIDADQPTNSAALGAATHCPDGTVEVSRGSLQPDDPPVAMAVDATDRTVAILTRGATLIRAAADPVNDAALDHLALDEGVRIASVAAPVETALLAIDGGVLAVAAGSRLVVADLGTGSETTHDLPSAARDMLMHDGAAWVATDSGVWADGTLIDGLAARLVVWQGAVWRIDVDGGVVALVTGSDEWAVAGLTGPAVEDPASGKLLVATDTGLVRLSTDGAVENIDDAPVIDLAANQAGELIVLGEAGRIHVYADETAYRTAAPLSVFVTTFSERPRSPDQDTFPCRADAGDSIASFLSTANLNRELLRDLPAPTALGLTPQLARRVEGCEQTTQLAALMAPPRFHPGALLHEQPEECAGDVACHASFVAAELGALTAVDIAPSWVSGLSPHHELDLDWVSSLRDAGAPDKFLFFGMSIRPDVPHEADLRAKDAWPTGLDNPGRAWSSDTSAAIDDRSGTGWLSIYPGDNVPSFNLGACANLYVNECHPLGRGGGTIIEDADIAVLDLLLHRSLAGGAAGEIRTWSFHLPDIGTYDYTEGCTRTDRVWTGEDCEASRLQQWLFDVHQRLVPAGLVQWTGPSDLAVP